MRKKIIILFNLFILNIAIYGQVPQLQSYAPVSPNSAALGTYGDIPVSYYTGTPKISVPVYNIKTNSLDFPIELDYHADGLKVLGESTFVGLDWTLSNSGVITRSVNSLDDLTPSGFFHNAPATRTVGSGIDPEPDIFYYNFNGRTGKFLIDYPGTIRLLNRQDDISIKIDANNNFNITTENGTIYSFTKHENQTNTITYTGASNSTNTVNYITAWYLTSITSPKKETVIFNYTSNVPRTITDRTTTVTSRFNSLTISNETTCALQNSGALTSQYQSAFNNVSACSTHSLTDEVLLDNIVFNGGKIQFSYSARTDLQNDMTNGGTQSQKLDQIVIYDNNANVVKTSHFIYDYFNSNTGQAIYTTTRLKLNAYQETPNGSSGSRNYIFGYNLPANRFPPKIDANFEPFGYFSSDPTIGILNQIKYPTGGTTNFTFEPNDMGMYGIRVKTIQNMDSNGQILSTKAFKYTELNANNQVVTSGKAMNITVHSFTTINPDVGTYSCTNTGSTSPSLSILSVNYTLTNQYSFTPIGESNTGNPYGYDQVTVLDGANGENGQTIYYYHNVADIVNGIGSPSTHDQSDGSLLSQEIYKNTGVNTFSLLKKNIYTYQSRNLVAVTGSTFSVTVKNAFANYAINTQNLVNLSNEAISYDGNSPVDEKTTYTYNASYQQPASQQTTNSQGNTITIINRYSYDMVSQGVTVPYQVMVNANMISQPIQIEKQINGTKLIESINNYSQNWSVNPSFILVSTAQTQNGTNPVETRIVNNNYDSYGNTISLSYLSGPKTSYLWGYKGLYVYAQCENGDSNEFFYQGFEDNNQTGVSGVLTNGIGHTGTAFISQPAVVSWQAPNSRAYILSYWYRSGGVWLYSGEINYTGTTYTLQNGDAYDDVRICPADAMLTSYTYTPLIGLSSTTDSKGKTTYYEYDGYNRLMNIKDQNGNIIKNFQYNEITPAP